MSDEEDDYMSAKFLENAEEFELKRKEETYSERRKKQLREQEKKSHIKPRAQLEAEEREKGLKRSLDEDKNNKGMKMLTKMGFKKGSSLGSGRGIVEPIKIDMKLGRYGIGMESELQKRTRELEEEEERKRKKTMANPDDFRALMAEKAKENQLTKYLNAAVSICEKLDENNDIESNILWTLKPIQPTENNTNDEENKNEEIEEVKEKEAIVLYPEEELKKLETFTLDERLELVIKYLRDTYHYCFWCRAKYNDKLDLDDNCPGPDEDSH
ncbi:uncharacterized protein BX663DRAFT_512896 [Cokeromyces recurvatus]|uniref:uncharacterized protein n=1 Tax=Cokeromyces recurvatus TaxID=90255 RepID=UPI00222061E4|nr:uncharacterized protein BX663DRAFT_512896 [Cokeromyces recurvatus]KAI7901917.1 hypothetical protein BX663DRAFT_512896 [Cokeromyces recurvatus]